MATYTHLSNLPPGVTPGDIDHEYAEDYSLCEACEGRGYFIVIKDGQEDAVECRRCGGEGYES